MSLLGGKPRAPRAFFLVGALLAACGGGGDEAAQRVELGTGEVSYEPIEGEPELTLARGSQGGFHVWASFVAEGFSGERLAMELRTTVVGQDDSTLVMRADLATRPFQDEEGEPNEAVRTFAGYPAQIFDARCGHGKRARLEITLSDDSGGLASDTRHCLLDVPESFRRSDCD